MDAAQLSLVAFSAFSVVRIYSYVPQIRTVALDQHGAAAISLSCWSIWIGANGSTAAYGWFCLRDPWLATTNGFATLGCAVVVILTAIKRRRLRRSQTLRAYAGLDTRP